MVESELILFLAKTAKLACKPSQEGRSNRRYFEEHVHDDRVKLQFCLTEDGDMSIILKFVSHQRAAQ